MVKDFSVQTGKKITSKGVKTRFINIEEIVYIKCEDYLSNIFLKDGTCIHEIKTLREFDKELHELGFFRIRNNIIINENYITELDTRIDKRAVKLGKFEFFVAKNRLKTFINSLS